MKNIIIYALIFLLAFIGTTYLIYDFNNKYVNMFEFDFRETAAIEAAIADSLAAIEADSLAALDSLHLNEEEAPKTEEIVSDLESTKGKLNKVSVELSKKDKEIEQLKSKLEIEHKAEHEQWLKATVKLYEEMQASKAAEILSKIPDIEAREIIYSMKKKKAAEVLSQLSTETIKRLTRAK